MPSFDAVYVEGVDDDERLARAFQAAFPSGGALLSRMEGSDWVQLLHLRGASLEQAAAALSEALGCRAVSFASHTAVDYVEVHEFSRGGEVRHLAYAGGGDRWEVVRGEAQPWEERLFATRDDHDVWVRNDRDRQVLADRRLVEGANVPSTTPFDVGCALDLPGFARRDGWHAPRWIGAPLPHPRASRWMAWMGLGVVALFVAMLVADLRWLPRSSWGSTAIVLSQVAFFVVALNCVQRSGR